MSDVVIPIEARRGFRLRKAGNLKPRPMDWTISGLFEKNSLLSIFGDAATAKTFWTLDMLACIATGKDHHGRKVHQGPVVYIAGEGFNGLARRLKAWSIHSEAELTDAPFYVSETPAALCDIVNVEAVLKAIDEIGDKPVMVGFDTVARNFGPGDENSTQDMTAFINGCDAIRHEVGCTVALIHHSGHADKTRARGSTVLRGALDAEYRLTRNPSGLISVECSKAKDFSPPEPFAFEFRSVELGIENGDGTEATSAVLCPTDVPEDKPQATGKNQRAALDQLHKLVEQHRANLADSGNDPRSARVRLDDWRAECMKVMARSGFYAAKKSLEDSGQITIEIGGYVRPNQ